MSSVVHIVRSPLHSLSPALFSEDNSAVVLSLEDPLLPGKVLRVTNNIDVIEGGRLSYEQVLAIVLESKKVMIL
jgi:hypothetical protein